MLNSEANFKTNLSTSDINDFVDKQIIPILNLITDCSNKTKTEELNLPYIKLLNNFSKTMRTYIKDNFANEINMLNTFKQSIIDYNGKVDDIEEYFDLDTVPNLKLLNDNIVIEINKISEGKYQIYDKIYDNKNVKILYKKNCIAEEA